MWLEEPLNFTEEMKWCQKALSSLSTPSFLQAEIISLRLELEPTVSKYWFGWMWRYRPPDSAQYGGVSTGSCSHVAGVHGCEPTCLANPLLFSVLSCLFSLLCVPKGIHRLVISRH